MIELGEEDNHEMHPEIMRTNKKIHQEAAAILYGENWVTEDILEIKKQPIRGVNRCPRHYSRLVTRMRLIVSTRGEVDSLAEAFALFWTTTNLKQICKVLSLNDVKILKVDIYNNLGHLYGGSARDG